jgi:NitT/TauT family transport system ATP-binding protein
VINVNLPRPRGIEARRMTAFIELTQQVTQIFLSRGILHGTGGF